MLSTSRPGVCKLGSGGREGVLRRSVEKFRENQCKNGREKINK